MRPIGLFIIMGKGEDTRQRIINEAMALVNERGVAGTSLSDLMAATGLQKGGIYRHFADKEEIVRAAFEQYVGIVKDRLQQAVSGMERSPDRLKAIFRLLAGIATKPVVPGGCMVLNLATETDFSGVGPRDLVGQTFRHWEKLLRDELESGIQAGQMKKDADVDEFLALSISAIEGAIVLQAHRPRLKPADHVIRHFERWIDELTLDPTHL